MMQIMVTGRDDVAAPPAFDPFIGIDFPACVIEDGIRDLVRSRGLGDVYKRQVLIARKPKHLRQGLGKGSKTFAY